MKRFIALLGLLLILAPAGAARADNNSFGIAWGISVPTGDTNDFASKMSFRGASAEWRNFYLRDAAYGLNVGWNVFNEDDVSTVSFANAAVTGKRWNYVNAVPVYASWFKYFSDDRRSSRFYAGMNVGSSWIERRTDIGLVSLKESNWHFALAPEVGWQLPWDSFLGYVGVRYHYAFEAGNMDAQQWLEFKIGFGLD
ncbi:MAG: hypothetical protein ABFS42_06300 [Candidatus Krumholzibacteriota bacterium]